MTFDRQERGPLRSVSHHDDPAEREADWAADVVAAGRTVGKTLSPAPTGTVHREPEEEKKEEKDKNAEQYKKAAETVAKALPKTEAGKAVTAKIMDDKAIKKFKDLLETPGGKIGAGVLAAGALGGLAAADQPLPIKPPAIPITRDLSFQADIQGSVRSPTYAGGGITWTPGAAEAKKKAEEAKKRAEKAKWDRERAELTRFQQGLQGKREDPLAVKEDDAWFVKQNKLMQAEKRRQEEEQKKAAPIRRSGTGRAPASARVDHALSDPGRPLDPATRTGMGARFGYDFSGVRIHNGPRASTVARSVKARAFTVGEHIVLPHGQPDTTTGDGRRLLAHELAHVVQQGKSE